MPQPNLPPARAHAVPAATACLLLAAALAACATAAPTPGGAGAQEPEPSGPDADRRLYEGRCGVCHVPFHPSDFPPRKWPAILADMAPRAGLTAEQRERVLRYVTAAAGGTGTSAAAR